MLILSINKFFWRKGGSETVFFDEIGLLESKGHKVIPFSMKSEDNIESEYSDYFVEYVDYGLPGLASKLGSASKIIYSIDARKKMKLLLKQIAPEVAHFHIFQHQISPSVFRPIRERNIPIILTLHDLKPMCPSYTMFTKGSICEKCKGGKFYNAVINKCTKGSTFGSMVNALEMYVHKFMGYYHQVDKYIAVSEFYLEKMVEFGFPRDKLVYIPNSVNANNYSKARSVSKYALYFGRLSEEKGIDTFVRAASINTKIQHLVVGTGPLQCALKKQIRDMGLTNITLLGFKSGDELKKIIREALVVVVPSVWYENCPMTILESFASYRPVIGSDIGGISELINSKYDGFLFEPNNANQLAHYIEVLYSNPDLADSFGDRGHTKVVEKFNEQNHVKKLIKLYSSLVGEVN